MKKICQMICLCFVCLIGLAAHIPNGNGVAASSKPATTGATEILLLSCMDYRLMDDIEHFMSHEGLANKYDHIVLAGASLGATNKKYPAWRKTFWEHLQVAINLHHIQKVMVMDHKDCGAYKVLLGESAVKTPELEWNTHCLHLRNLLQQIKAHHPKLEVELLLMSLDGSVEKIPPAKAVRRM
jgi:carbonic anhydrase